MVNMKDTKANYGEISLLNHWVTAVFVVIMLTLGLVYEALPSGESADSVIFWHISVGLLASPFIIWRIVWRMKSGFPTDQENGKPERIIKKTTHVLLLVAIGLLIMTGPMYLWTETQSLPFFGLLEIPSPFSEESEWLHEAVETIHKFAAIPTLVALLSLHFLATLKNIFWNKRRTFFQK